MNSTRKPSEFIDTREFRAGRIEQTDEFLKVLLFKIFPRLLQTCERETDDEFQWVHFERLPYDFGRDPAEKGVGFGSDIDANK